MEPTDRELLIRIDERTEAQHTALTAHMEQDRADFKEVHGRINRLTRGIGVVSGIGVAVGFSLAWIKGIFGQ